MDSAINLETEVLVVGGGTAGTITALQSGRLGRTTSTGGIHYISFFGAY